MWIPGTPTVKPSGGAGSVRSAATGLIPRNRKYAGRTIRTKRETEACMKYLFEAGFFVLDNLWILAVLVLLAAGGVVAGLILCKKPSQDKAKRKRDKKR